VASIPRYLAESHLASTTVARHELPFTIEEILARQGLARRVACTVSNLALAPLIVSRTDLIATAVWRSVAPFAQSLGVRALPPPFEVPSIQLRLVWHERFERDEAHAWLRRIVSAVLD
jgi:DNA-binding transcriptional LysR family regulator